MTMSIELNIYSYSSCRLWKKLSGLHLFAKFFKTQLDISNVNCSQRY